MAAKLLVSSSLNILNVFMSLWKQHNKRPKGNNCFHSNAMSYNRLKHSNPSMRSCKQDELDSFLLKKIICIQHKSREIEEVAVYYHLFNKNMLMCIDK